MSLNNEQTQRNKQILRDLDAQRFRMANSEPQVLNLPPPPPPMSLPPTSNVPSRPPPISIKPSYEQTHFHIPPPPSSMVLGDSLSAFQKDRLHDVLQQGLGTYVFVDNFGLVPKLSHF